MVYKKSSHGDIIDDLRLPISADSDCGPVSPNTMTISVDTILTYIVYLSYDQAVEEGVVTDQCSNGVEIFAI